MYVKFIYNTARNAVLELGRAVSPSHARAIEVPADLRKGNLITTSLETDFEAHLKKTKARVVSEDVFRNGGGAGVTGNTEKKAKGDS